MHHRRIARFSLMGLVLAGPLVVGGLVPASHAETGLRRDIRQDRRNIIRLQRRLNRDVRRHGAFSREAMIDRRQLRQERRDIRNDMRDLRQRQGYGRGYRDNWSNRRGWGRW